jgi:DNA-3-methyladenine glycosylase I
MDLMLTKKRCDWCTSDSMYIDYHDHEWGRPLRDEKQLFELLMLEGMQAGLSWLTVLKKREAYRQSFFQFDPEKIALMLDQDVDRLMLNPSIIRHRNKIEAIISNAQSFLALKRQGIHFSTWLWSVVNDQPIIHDYPSIEAMPVCNELSHLLSKKLKKAGFKFVGPTICYAFMQASGMIQDHTTDCFLHSKNA